LEASCCPSDQIEASNLPYQPTISILPNIFCHSNHPPLTTTYNHLPDLLCHSNHPPLTTTYLRSKIEEDHLLLE
jgi:hypothetical protein